MVLGSLTAALMLGSLTAPTQRVDEKGLFHIPGVEDFRVQKISKVGSEQGWPFTIDEGYLLCAYVLGQAVVYFTNIPKPGVMAEMPVHVSSNPFDLGFGNMAARHLVRADLSLVELIALMGPLEATGKRLCDQPPGSHIGSGEL